MPEIGDKVKNTKTEEEAEIVGKDMGGFTVDLPDGSMAWWESEHTEILTTEDTPTTSEDIDITECGSSVRPLFDEATIPHHEDETGEISGQSYGLALGTLYKCLGIEPSISKSLDEAERWVTYFNLHYATIKLEQNDKEKAIEILEDLQESFSIERSRELGIEQDYGEETVNEIFNNLSEALDLLGKDEPENALTLIKQLEDNQYALNLERAGTPTPGGE